MKKNLGKLFLLLLLPVLLFGQKELATHTLSANKESAYIKEAVAITFTAVQKDHEDVMFFFLNPKKSDAYDITLLNKATKKIGYHNYTTTFTYLLFPLKEGKIKVDFDYTIKTASDDAVAQVYIGSRDNVKWIDTVDTIMPTQSVILSIKPLAKDIELVGDFKLTAALKNNTIDQFSTAHIVYTLNGVGYVNKTFAPLKKIDKATLFNDTLDRAFKTTKNGQVLEREYIYAISGDDDFTIPKIKIKAYSPRSHTYYTLEELAHDITVSKIDPNTLLDEKEFPKAQSVDFSWLLNAVIALCIFIAGFISAKLSTDIRLPWRINRERFKDIKESKDAKALLIVLLNKYNTIAMQPYVAQLEVIAYKKININNFKKVKKEIIKILSSS